MDDYTKAMKIQELEGKKLPLLWEYQMSFVIFGDRSSHEIFIEMLNIDKQIKELQNG